MQPRTEPDDRPRPPWLTRQTQPVSDPHPLGFRQEHIPQVQRHRGSIQQMPDQRIRRQTRIQPPRLPPHPLIPHPPLPPPPPPRPPPPPSPGPPSTPPPPPPPPNNPTPPHTTPPPP